MTQLLNLLLMASTAMAADTALNLDIELSINGAVVTQSEIITLSGQKASIQPSVEGEGYFIEVTPTVEKDNQIQMQFVVAKVNGSKKTVLSEAQIITLLGQVAQIQQGNTDSKESLSLTVTASEHQ